MASKAIVGSATITLPITTLWTPKFNTSCIAPKVRNPPPSWIGTDTWLTISSITKLSEGDYKEAKKDNPEEFVTYEDYQQVSYKLTFKGTFIDYINFIKDLQIADKSLSTDNALIKKQDDETINVTSTLIVKLMKI